MRMIEQRDINSIPRFFRDVVRSPINKPIVKYFNLDMSGFRGHHAIQLKYRDNDIQMIFDKDRTGIGKDQMFFNFLIYPNGQNSTNEKDKSEKNVDKIVNRNSVENLNIE